jgi:plasmid maintenance system antidote protein VapI
MEGGGHRPDGSAAPSPPGLLIRQRLYAQGMTEQGLADSSGERLETINRIICRRCRLTALKALAISAVLGCSAELLLDAQRDVDLWELRHETSS